MSRLFDCAAGGTRASSEAGRSAPGQGGLPVAGSGCLAVVVLTGFLVCAGDVGDEILAVADIALADAVDMCRGYLADSGVAELVLDEPQDDAEGGLPSGPRRVLALARYRA